MKKGLFLLIILSSLFVIGCSSSTASETSVSTVKDTPPEVIVDDHHDGEEVEAHGHDEAMEDDHHDGEEVEDHGHDEVEPHDDSDQPPHRH